MCLHASQNRPLKHLNRKSLSLLAKENTFMSIVLLIFAQISCATTRKWQIHDRAESLPPCSDQSIYTVECPLAPYSFLSADSRGPLLPLSEIHLLLLLLLVLLLLLQMPLMWVAVNQILPLLSARSPMTTLYTAHSALAACSQRRPRWLSLLRSYCSGYRL